MHQPAACLTPYPLVYPQAFDDYLHQACVGSKDRDTRWRLLTQWAKAPGGKEVGGDGRVASRTAIAHLALVGSWAAALCIFNGPGARPGAVVPPVHGHGFSGGMWSVEDTGALCLHLQSPACAFGQSTESRTGVPALASAGHAKPVCPALWMPIPRFSTPPA